MLVKLDLSLLKHRPGEHDCIALGMPYVCSNLMPNRNKILDKTCSVCADPGAGLRYEPRASQCYTLSLYMHLVVIQNLD